MQIKTNGEQITTLFSSFVPTKAADHVIKAFEKDGVTETKMAPDGSERPQFRTSLQALHVDENGEVDRQERDVTFSVLKPADVKAGVYYKASGTTWITHYVTNAGRLGVSIVAESIVPQTDSKPVASTEKSA